MTPSAFFQGPTSATSHSLPRHGTPPLSRNSSSGSYSKRSSVVPFTRPGRPSDDGTEGGTPSQSGTPVGFRPRRTSSSQGMQHSLEDYSFSQSPARGRRAAENRAPSGHPPAARAEGFKVVQDTTSTRASESSASPAGEESPKGAGLLSRHFSGTMATGSPPPSGEVLKERLQKCLDKPAGGLHYQSNLQPENAASRLLRELQGQFEVFSLPSVVHAFAVASSVLRDNHHIGRGQPPMVRNLETAAILAELGASTACISAALFHGALEVQAMSESRLRETLQHDVASLAVSSARLADLCKVRRQAAIGMDPDTLRKFSHMLLAMADVQAVILVLADRLQMLRAQDSTSVAARDVLEVFAPLADQLDFFY
ncbi:hypothetical protein WJX73_005013 [Symbiochloris irregularis]|uniref:Uncharacterized protein n=1 Tax=Symbiochloris irregularis TaxID=706552 RepID=A0AAW1NZ50_9CHLO